MSSLSGLIEVDHLIKSCDGDPEKLAGLGVMISLAKTALETLSSDARDDRQLIQQQCRQWSLAIDEIQRQLKRALSN